MYLEWPKFLPELMPNFEEFKKNTDSYQPCRGIQTNLVEAAKRLHCYSHYRRECLSDLRKFLRAIGRDGRGQ